jgi:hypothetical protein
MVAIDRGQIPPFRSGQTIKKTHPPQANLGGADVQRFKYYRWMIMQRVRITLPLCNRITYIPRIRVVVVKGTV